MVLDTALRGGALAVILLTGAGLLLAARSRPTLSVAAFGLCAGCYVIVSAPGPVAAVPGRLLTAGAMLAPPALAWMMMELLTDPTDPRRAWRALLGLGAGVALLAPPGGGAQTPRALLAVAFYLGLAWLAARSGRGDLVDSRRRFRRAVLGALGLTGVAISAVEATGADGALPAWAYPLQAGAMLLLSLAFALWALRANRDLLGRSAAASAPAAAHSALAQRLAETMAAGIWRREGLTIGALADALGVPEHRLRRTINGELGHRNFSTFVNGHRIAAAQAMLRDPAHAGRTILEIAYDTGFASLGPFNRAFRATTGQSPREYRRAVSE